MSQLSTHRPFTPSVPLVVPKSAPLVPHYWRLGHAVWMLLALSIGMGAGHATWTALACAASLAYWVWWQRELFVGGAGFGAANGVTSLRVVSLVALGIGIDRAEPRAVAACAFAIFALDGLDGWLARRTQRASAFGAQYDMETDACFVLVLSLGLWQLGRAGVWVGFAGALRYLYVLGLRLAHREQAEAPRSRLGRYVFACVVSAFTCSFWFTPLTPLLPAAATLLLTYSFARGALASLREPADAIMSR